MTDLSFINWGEIPEKANYTAIPAGWYNAIIDKAELVDTKTGGRMIKFTFKILDGKYENRLIFSQVNIKNVSIKAQEVGLTLFNELRKALKKTVINSTQELLNEKVRIKVSVYENDYQGVKSDKNDVKDFEPIESIVPSVAAKADDAAGLPF